MSNLFFSRAPYLVSGCGSWKAQTQEFTPSLADITGGALGGCLGVRQGWRFPSWRDSSGAWAPCILVHCFPAAAPWPLICCQTPLPWFPRQGRRNSAPAQHRAGKTAGCSSPGALCHLTRRETNSKPGHVTPSVWMLLLFQGCLLTCFQGSGEDFPTMLSHLLTGSTV